MLRSVVTVDNYDQIRARAKRKAVEVLRQLVDAVPELGDVTVFLKADHRAQDAIMTLHAMSFSPYLITVFVGRRRFTEQTALAAISGFVTRSLVSIIKGVNFAEPT